MEFDTWKISVLPASKALVFLFMCRKWFWVVFGMDCRSKKKKENTLNHPPLALPLLFSPTCKRKYKI